MKSVSNSVQDTEKIGFELASKTKKGVVAMFGELGAGKTSFVRGFCKGIGYEGRCSSPTFAIVNEYIGGSVPVYHFDMYRITSSDDLYSCGFYDYLYDNCILIIEWSENILSELPADCIKVTISKRAEDENIRDITIEGVDL